MESRSEAAVKVAALMAMGTAVELAVVLAGIWAATKAVFWAAETPVVVMVAGQAVGMEEVGSVEVMGVMALRVEGLAQVVAVAKAEVARAPVV